MSNQPEIATLIPDSIGISLSKYAKLLVGLSLAIQCIIIAYNHISGYSVLSGYPHFISKLIISSALTFLSVFSITYPNLFLISWLNKRLDWEKSMAQRVLVQLLFTILIAVSISTIVTTLTHFIREYENGLTINLVYNALIFSVCNLILVAIFEAWIQFIEAKSAKEQELALKSENAQIRFELLKNQINPHFMFNSLNVLSSLIEKDRTKAQRFIDEFSKMYRYVLQTIEKPLVPLSEELDFVETYIFLQKIRYGDTLQFSVDLPSEVLNQNIPPFALQVLVENACKHNLLTIDRPLSIQITIHKNRLLVKNTYQPKLSNSSSSKVGQKNLVSRYLMISEERPKFRLTDGHYIVLLPLI